MNTSHNAKVVVRNIVIKSSRGPILELCSSDSDSVVKAYAFVKKVLAQGGIVSVVSTDIAIMDIFMKAWMQSWHGNIASRFFHEGRVDGSVQWYDITFFNKKEDEVAARDLVEHAYFWALCA